MCKVVIMLSCGYQPDANSNIGTFEHTLKKLNLVQGRRIKSGGIK